MAFINAGNISEKKLRCKKKGAANTPRLKRVSRL
jgi:hypothetical protein